jgi:pyrroloquinoline-quinone synthase
MNHTDTLRQLDDLIQSRSILKHPFYKAWQQGKLTRDQLATYARAYYPHVASFTGYLRSAIGTADDQSVLSELENNLSDELSNPAPHAELWLDFAECLGLERKTVSNSPPNSPTQQTVGTFNRLAKGKTAGTLSALYAYESQQPEVSKTKMEGLQTFYGISNPMGLAYFQVHAEKDIEHRDGERRAIARCLERGESPETVLTAASTALDAYWGLLDGICEEAGIHCPAE